MTRRELLRYAAVCAVAGAISTLDAADVPASQPALPERPLGKTGVSVPILGLGGAGFLIEMKDRDAIAAMVNEAIDLGIRYFDTAPVYGDGRSEENLGLVMGTPKRKGLFLATKTDQRTYDTAMRQVESSLKRLRVDRVDLIQVHHVWEKDDVKALGGKDGVIPALRKLQEQKVTRFVGMTGHPNYPQVKEALEMHEWDTFLCFINPKQSTRPVFEQQLPVARRKGMGIIAMKVYGGSTPGQLVGDTPGKAAAPLLLRYALGQPISVAIPAPSTAEQLRENVRVARAFRPLSEEEERSLAERVNPREG